MARTDALDTDARQDRLGRFARAVAALPRLPFVAAIVALGFLVWLGRDMTFYHDEYTFILLRDLSLRGIFAPHNEHLSATLVILYRVLLGTVGMVSYWPYLAVTFALHLAVSGIVYVVVRRLTSSGWALGAMAVMLVLGAGGDDVLWAFQSGTIGAVAAGMAAIVVAPRRPRLAAGLMTVSMATSGASLAFLVGTAAHLALTRPRALVWLVIPVALYLVWFIAFGAEGVTALRSPSPDGVPEYILSGLTASAAGALGSAIPVVGSVGLLALVFGLGWIRSVDPVVVALLVAAVAFFAIAGLVRAQLGADQADAPRYVYIAAPAFLVAGTVLIARIRRPFAQVVGAVVLAVALVGNVGLLIGSHDRLVSKIECEKALTPLQRGSAGNPC